MLRAKYSPAVHSERQFNNMVSVSLTEGSHYLFRFMETMNCHSPSISKRLIFLGDGRRDGGYPVPPPRKIRRFDIDAAVIIVMKHALSLFVKLRSVWIMKITDRAPF